VERLLSQIDGFPLEEQIVMRNPAKILPGCDQAHACGRDDSKAVGRTAGEKNGGKSDMKDEEEDERACNPARKMDEKKHGAIVKAHLPEGEPFDIFLLTGFLFNLLAQQVENEIVNQNEAGQP
jgi:hypothetical protein